MEHHFKAVEKALPDFSPKQDVESCRVLFCNCVLCLLYRNCNVGESLTRNLQDITHIGIKTRLSTALNNK